MTQLYEIKVSLSPNQKKNLSNAFHKRETIILRLTKDSLSGNDTLYVPSTVEKRLRKNQKLKKGMDIKLSKTNIRKQVGGFSFNLNIDFRIPQNKIDQLIAYKHLLTDKQKRDILNSIQSGGQLVMKPTKSQYGGFLGTLLASIGIPLAVEAIKKMTGGAPRMGSKLEGHGAPRIGMYQPPPFIGTWEQARKGGGKKKKKSQEQDYCWEKTVHSKTSLS